MKVIIPLLIALLVCTLNAACSNGDKQPLYYISGDHPLLSYTGRVDQSIKGQTSFSYSAVELNCAFSGTRIQVVLNQQSVYGQSDYVDVWLDGIYKGKVQISPGPEQKIEYTSADMKVQSVHTLKLVKRTEASVGKIIVYKIGLDAEKNIQQYHPSYAYTIEFIGNSITCGYGNEVSIPVGESPSTGFHSENENAYMSYAGITARNCNTRAVYVSYSGKGMYRNYDGAQVNTMPLLYDRIHPDDVHSAQWKTSTYAPDIIVINLGTNDYASEAFGTPLKDSIFIQTYIQFVGKLVALYPNAMIICAGGGMMSDAWPEGRQALTRFKTSVHAVCKDQHAKGNTKIYPFFFSTQSAPFGEDYHPTIAFHTKMAEELTAFIKTLKLK